MPQYVVVLAETIQPRLSAHQYLDGAEFELEIKQVCVQAACMFGLA